MGSWLQRKWQKYPSYFIKLNLKSKDILGVPKKASGWLVHPCICFIIKDITSYNFWSTSIRIIATDYVTSVAPLALSTKIITPTTNVSSGIPNIPLKP